MISIPALCFGAFNITYQCDWRPLIYSSQTILSSTPIRWPWVEYPNESDMRVNATSLDKSVYLDGPLDYQCSFGRLTQRSAIKRIAQKCTLTVNKDGSVMSDAFQDCYLLKSSKCISLTTHLIAVPVSIPKSISACPVIVVDIDVALVEMQTSRPSYISATGLLTKRSFFWTPLSRNKELACTHPLTGASILKDEGGYLLTMEIINHPDLTPTLMLSDTFNQSLYPPSSLSSETLKNNVKKLTSTPKWSSLRSKRSVGGLLFKQIEWELSQLETPNNNHSRHTRSPVLNLLTGATTLQLSFHRAEYQHDITSGSPI